MVVNEVKERREATAYRSSVFIFLSTLFYHLLSCLLPISVPISISIIRPVLRLESIPSAIFLFLFLVFALRCVSRRLVGASSLLEGGWCRLVESLFAAPSLVVAIIFGLDLGFG